MLIATIAAGALTVILIFIMFHVVELKILIMLRSYYCKILLMPNLVGRFFKIDIEFLLEYAPFEGIKIMKRSRGGRMKFIKFLGQKKKDKKNKYAVALRRALITAANAKRFEITGEIGIKDNAYASIVSAGVIEIILRNILIIAVPEIFAKDSDNELCISFYPNMNGSAFSLNLEGLLEIRPIKLIKEAWEKLKD